VNVSFSPGFRWGAATSAYQIEGATTEDGRGPSIWDLFVRERGAISEGDTGDVAADHYRRFPEDIAMMKEMGLQAYRFSTSWSRVLPEGTGRPNNKGLDFYNQLVDLLLEHGIEPFLTLYHWDLPQALHDKGGWATRATVDAFQAYAELMIGSLGDRVRHWSTVNEPWTITFLGYSWGIHAPGVKDPATAFVVAHHLLLAHGAAARAISAPTREVMINLNLTPIHSASDRAEDLGVAASLDGLQNRMWLDPLLKGSYPEDVLPIVDKSAGLDHIRDGDLEEISGTVDELGVNYYTTLEVEAAEGELDWPMFPGAGSFTFKLSKPTTAMGWEIHPDGLFEMLVRIKREYPPIPLYVTENGAAFEDVFENGDVHDPERVSYIHDHIEACRRAITAGVDLRGYFVWSLLDNFEWAEGYSKRFGIVRVDYKNQTRIMKDSARWYSDFISKAGP
jgi:beta-glucosidase